MTHRIVLVSPGGLGAELATHLVGQGFDVVSPLAGRGEATRARARVAGIRDGGTLAEAIDSADMILSLVPPAAALEVARAVAEALANRDLSPIYVDANSISPATARAIEAIVGATGARFVDAAVIAPTPRSIETTRIHACGPGLDAFVRLASAGGLTVHALGGETGRASALRMAYACVSKGVPAMWIGMLLIARSSGVLDELRHELGATQPDLAARMPSRIERLPSDAERWAGEAEELATTFEDVGLSPTLFEGVAEIYRTVAASTAVRRHANGGDDIEEDEVGGRVAALIESLAIELAP